MIKATVTVRAETEEALDRALETSRAALVEGRALSDGYAELGGAGWTATASRHAEPAQPVASKLGRAQRERELRAPESFTAR